jgi:polyhydroxyalkanoate synthesis regulator protein
MAFVTHDAALRLCATPAGCGRSRDDLSTWDAAGRALRVMDAETGDDVTRILLA